MGSIFNTLSIGYSGLNAAQMGVDTTSHNITNAESEGYTRQRVSQGVATPISTSAGNVGNGTRVEDIARIFDNFVYDRYTSIASDKEYSDFTKTTLETLSTYFPEIDGVGIKSDLQEYFNMWQTFADNPDNDAIKLALAKQTEALSNDIIATQTKIMDLQSSLNEQLKTNVDEVNVLAKQLSEINISIEVAESAGGFSANDLRDKRNQLELDLARLIGANSINGQIESNMGFDSRSNETSGSYTINVNGFNIVDGGTFHPIHISNTQNANGFYELSYERQDGVLIPMDEKVMGGKVGAILDLRGDKIVSDTSGVPSNGTLQKVVDEMNAFATALIESTNNLYAAGATTSMTSNRLDMSQTQALLDTSLNIKEGAFEFVIYDIDGNETARKSITIDNLTMMTGAAGTNSIEGQLKAQSDDNADGSANNDVDDFITSFHWTTFADGKGSLSIGMEGIYASKGYTFAIEDKLTSSGFDSGSNFAGALGLSRFFDGDNAANIALNRELQQNPTDIKAGRSPSAGDNALALGMVQQQFEEYAFDVTGLSYNSTLYGMFDVIATEVGVRTNEAVLNNQTITAQYSAVELEYSSVSKVSIDEELVNLIKYQTSYGAASKIITTIDQMMQTLLGIKQ